MERPHIETAVTGNADAPPAQCPHCTSRILFWWRNPKGRSFTWFCSSCRMVHTRALVDSPGPAALKPTETNDSTEQPARPSSLSRSRPATRQPARAIGLPDSFK